MENNLKTKVDNNKAADYKGQPPFLLELMFTLSKLVVVIIGSVVGIISYQSGSPLWMVIVRVSLSMFVLGLVFWMVSWFVTRGYLEAVLHEKVEQEKKDFSSNTMELQV